MTAPQKHEPTPERDEVDELFDAARGLAGRREPVGSLDWSAVLATARRRQMQRLALAVSVAALMAGGTVFLAVRSWALPGEGTSHTAQAQVPATATGGMEEYRLVRVAPRVMLVAERDTALELSVGSAVTLLSGTVWVRVDSSAGPVPFDVVTPDVRISVVGTRFAVRAAPGGGTSVAVLEGRVRVKSSGGEVALDAGREWSSGAAQPVELSAAWRGSLESLLDGTRTYAAQCVAGLAPEATGGEGRALANGPAAVRVPPTTTVEEEAAPLPGEIEAEAGGATRPAATRDAGAEPVDAHSETTSGETEALYRRAEEAMAGGRIQEAVGLLEQVATRARGTALGGLALVDLAARRLQLGDAAGAANAYRRYLEEQAAGPFRGETRIALCRIALRAGRGQEARACYAAYLVEQPAGPYAGEAARGAAGEEGR
jgi:hypothetical protein